MVLRRCRSMLRSEAEAVDAMQDVFVELLRRRERLLADSGSESALSRGNQRVSEPAAQVGRVAKKSQGTRFSSALPSPAVKTEVKRGRLSTGCFLREPVSVGPSRCCTCTME